MPLLHDVHDITLTRNGWVALVSYENKAPPQLWKIQLVRNPDDRNDAHARLSLSQTYMPSSPVEFACPSYFGGDEDQPVLCAGKSEAVSLIKAIDRWPLVSSGGDIHIWDRDSSVLLHSLQTPDMDGDLTCIAWNHAAMPFMFATGSHDGTVRIWSTPPVADVSSLNAATPNPQRDASPVSRLNDSSTVNARPRSSINDGIERKDSPALEDKEVDSVDGHTPHRSLGGFDAVGASGLQAIRIQSMPPDTTWRWSEINGGNVFLPKMISRRRNWNIQICSLVTY